MIGANEIKWHLRRANVISDLSEYQYEGHKFTCMVAVYASLPWPHHHFLVKPQIAHYTGKNHTKILKTSYSYAEFEKMLVMHQGNRQPQTCHSIWPTGNCFRHDRWNQLIKNPSKIAEMKSWLTLCNVYWRFAPNFVQINVPLNKIFAMESCADGQN